MSFDFPMIAHVAAYVWFAMFATLLGLNLFVATARRLHYTQLANRVARSVEPYVRYFRLPY
jgi:heme exporter protein D